MEVLGAIALWVGILCLFTYAAEQNSKEKDAELRVKALNRSYMMEIGVFPDTGYRWVDNEWVYLGKGAKVHDDYVQPRRDAYGTYLDY